MSWEPPAVIHAGSLCAVPSAPSPRAQGEGRGEGSGPDRYRGSPHTIASFAEVLAIVAAEAPGTDASWRSALWHQFGAAIDMLDNAVADCPGALWSDRSQTPEFWYVAFHALFFLDFYLGESPDGFAPPSPFTLSDVNSDGELPERPYTKEELRGYLRHGREKCRRSIEALSDERARERTGFLDGSLTALELLLYNMRHVQHHAGQLNLILRQKTQSAPRWVSRAREEAETT